MRKIITATCLAACLISIALVACGGGGSADAASGATATSTATTANANCQFVSDSLTASTTGAATLTCDTSYAYIASNGLATHPMMEGIAATNLQVPVAQNFLGSNGWKIPLAPAIAATTTSAVDGPIGVAINGVPIFNPCKQGGCLNNNDTKVAGELDNCNGHAGRADDYHYHAAPTCLMAGKAASYWDTHPLGWALDGFAIYGFNNPDGTPATRDTICGGNTLAVPNGPTGYSYHVTNDSPYVLSCFRGTPSPDRVNQGAKFTPLRKPPVDPPFPATVVDVTLAVDDYQVMNFKSAQAFTTNTIGTDSYANAPGSYNIRFKQLLDIELSAALVKNTGKTACWNFQFTNSAGATTQPSTTYCR